MKLFIQSISSIGGLIAFAATVGLEGSPTHAQVLVNPGYAHRRPYVYVNPGYNAGVLPGFAPRGGIGTTPFLGNTRGLGAYSHNFDNDYRRSTTTYRNNYRRWNRRIR